MAVYVAVCEIFNVKEWCDLENKVRVSSRSLEMALFDRSHTSSYSLSIVTMGYIVSSARYSDLGKKSRFFYTQPVFIVPQGVTRGSFVTMFDADKTRMIGLPYGEKSVTIC